MTYARPLCQSLRSLLLLAACLPFAMAGSAAAQTEARTLTLTATGEVAAAPDMALLTLSIDAEALTAAQALQQAAMAAQDVFSVLDAAGIVGADRQTAALSLRELHDRDERGQPLRRAGFAVSQGLTIRVRALDRLGGLIDSLIEAGLTGLGGITFAVSDRAALLDEARRRAVAEASRTAALVAGAAGETLGQPLEIELVDHTHRPAPMRALAADSVAAMPLAEGEVTVGASVTIRYALN